MVSKFKKRCSILLVIRKIKIKITMRYQYLHTRMCKIKMPKITKAVAQLELSHSAGGSIDWYNYFGKLFGNKAKYLCPFIYPTEITAKLSKRCVQVSQQCYSQKANNSNVYQRRID